MGETLDKPNVLNVCQHVLLAAACMLAGPAIGFSQQHDYTTKEAAQHQQWIAFPLKCVSSRSEAKDDVQVRDCVLSMSAP
jgi:hypothetical protein